MIQRTSDPVADMEAYYARKPGVVCECAVCGKELEDKHGVYESDPYYLLPDGTTICWSAECLTEWADSVWLMN